MASEAAAQFKDQACDRAFSVTAHAGFRQGDGEAHVALRWRGHLAQRLMVSTREVLCLCMAGPSPTTAGLSPAGIVTPFTEEGGLPPEPPM